MSRLTYFLLILFSSCSILSKNARHDDINQFDFEKAERLITLLENHRDIAFLISRDTFFQVILNDTIMVRKMELANYIKSCQYYDSDGLNNNYHNPNYSNIQLDSTVRFENSIEILEILKATSHRLTITNNRYYFETAGMLDARRGFLYADSTNLPEIGNRMDLGPRLNHLDPVENHANWHYYYIAN